MESTVGINMSLKATKKNIEAKQAAEAGDAAKEQANRKEAEKLRQASEISLKPSKATEIGPGNESLPQKTTGIENYQALCLKETLENPSQISLDASLRRMELASNANIMPMAVDAAQTVNAKNSIEKMLCHQMALCHEIAMDLGARVQNEGDTIEAARLVNSTARLMNTFQQSIHALHKLRSGGQQIVTVQHVKIDNTGGQTLVTGKIDKGGG